MGRVNFHWHYPDILNKGRGRSRSTDDAMEPSQTHHGIAVDVLVYQTVKIVISKCI